MTLDILIIDDKDTKIDALRHVITPLFTDDDVVIDEAHTIAEGRDTMRERTYDLLILDMVVPELDGEEPSRTAGAEFLNELYDNDSVQKPLQIIGLTEYEAEYNQQQAEFRDRLWYLLLYSQSKLEWKKMLKSKVLQLMKMKRNFVESLEDVNRYDVGIVCSDAAAFEQMQKAFRGCRWDDCRLPSLPWLFRTTRISTSAFHDLRVIAACADHQGDSATTVLATALYTAARIGTLFLLASDGTVPTGVDQNPSALVSMAKSLASEEGYEIDFGITSEVQKTLSYLTSNIMLVAPENAEFLYMLLREKF